MDRSYWDKYAAQRIAQRSAVELRRQRGGVVRVRAPLRRRSAPTRR